MAKVKLMSLLKGLSGKLSKSEDQVFYQKFGSTWVWNNKGVHSFNTAQVAIQTRFTQAQSQVETILGNSTQKATYQTGFAGQTKYKTLRTYVFAQVMAQLKLAADE